jgi:hypothetical protein
VPQTIPLLPLHNQGQQAAARLRLSQLKIFWYEVSEEKRFVTAFPQSLKSEVSKPKNDSLVMYRVQMETREEDFVFTPIE